MMIMVAGIGNALAQTDSFNGQVAASVWGGGSGQGAAAWTGVINNGNAPTPNIPGGQIAWQNQWCDASNSQVVQYAYGGYVYPTVNSGMSLYFASPVSIGPGQYTHGWGTLNYNSGYTTIYDLKQIYQTSTLQGYTNPMFYPNGPTFKP